MVQVLTIQKKMRVYLRNWVQFLALYCSYRIYCTSSTVYCNSVIFSKFEKFEKPFQKFLFSPLFMISHFLAFLPILKNFIYPSLYTLSWEVLPSPLEKVRRKYAFFYNGTICSCVRTISLY